MFKKAVLSLITIAVLTVSGTFIYHSLEVNNTQKALSRAKIECSEKIPDEQVSVNRSGSALNPSYMNYINYPAFDRCMAGKGF